MRPAAPRIACGALADGSNRTADDIILDSGRASTLRRGFTPQSPLLLRRRVGVYTEWLGTVMGILAIGSVPLPVLEQRMTQFITEEEKGSTGAK